MVYSKKMIDHKANADPEPGNERCPNSKAKSLSVLLLIAVTMFGMDCLQTAQSRDSHSREAPSLYSRLDPGERLRHMSESSSWYSSTGSPSRWPFSLYSAFLSVGLFHKKSRLPGLAIAGLDLATVANGQQQHVRSRELATLEDLKLAIEANSVVKAQPNLYLMGELESFWSSKHSPLVQEKQTKDLVILFMDTSYLDTLNVWLAHYKKHDNSNRVLCLFLIDEAYDVAAPIFADNDKNILEGLGTVLLSQLSLKSDNNKLLWKLRVNILNQLAHALPHVNFLFTDSDAIWLQDPQVLFATHPDSDVVGSRGRFPLDCQLYSAPQDATLPEDAGLPEGYRGASICFGLVYFRNSPILHQLTDRIQEQMDAYNNDDQKTINCIFYNDYFRHSMLPQESEITLESPIEFDFSHKTTQEHIQVTIVPYNKVLRYCEDQSSVKEAVVAHCRSRHKGEAKMAMFDQFHLIPDDGALVEYFH